MSSTQSGNVWSEKEAILLQQIKELRYLVGVLLAKSGLDGAGIQRAFELAHMETERLDNEMIAIAGERFRQRPEGQVAKRYETERLQREISGWREDCLEDGRIYPSPSKRSESKEGEHE